MDIQSKIVDNRKNNSDVEVEEEEFTSTVDRTLSTHSSVSILTTKSHPDHEKRVRREIANSNERRRMQSINAGFQSLRTLIPHGDGEKMSKAGILQQSAEHIQNLESEKTRLMSQNAQLKAMVRDMSGRHPHTSSGSTSTDSDSSAGGSPPPKRKKRDTESSDEGISMGFDDPLQEDLKKEMIELRRQLERERRLRMKVEDERRALEAQLHPEGTGNILATTTQQPPEVVRRVEALPHARQHTEQQRHVSEQQERHTECVKPVETRAPSLLPSSMSRRNLETIVEAIRHLEGDSMLDVDKSPPQGGTNCIPEAGAMESAEEDSSSGRDSPLCLTVRRHVPSDSIRKALPAHTTSTSTADRYPIAMQLLHPPVPGGRMLPTQFMPHRPAVIVQKSS